jgi:hypothetical protein
MANRYGLRDEPTQVPVDWGGWGDWGGGRGAGALQ